MLNTTDQWKMMMLGLPDNEFFAIMRNYLGKLETPFNKHSLIEALEDFLLRDETETRILSMIDEEDALLLTSINFLSGTDIHELHDFLGKERSFMAIHHLLLNLEERLLIYRDPGNGRIKISPLFQNLFEKNVFNTDLLFPSEKCEETKFPDIWFTDALVISFVTFLLKIPDIFKLDGTIKKKAKDEINNKFPNLLTEEKAGLRLTILIKSLQGLSLIHNNQEKLILMEENILKYSKLPSRQRYLLYTAAAASNNLNYAQTGAVSDIIEKLITAIPEKTSFNMSSIKKLLLLIIKKSRTDFHQTDLLLDTLVSLSYLVPVKDRFSINPHLKDHFNFKAYPEPPVIVQPSFDLTIKPWINLKDGLKIACIAEIKKFDLYPHFEINKASYTRGHDCIINNGNAVETLEELSGRTIPQNISVSMKSWEEDYNNIKLFEGIVLTVNKDKRIIFDHLENLEQYIRYKLAEGVFLMDSEKESEWRTIIENTGIIVPEIKREYNLSNNIEAYETPELNKNMGILKIPVSKPQISKNNINFHSELIKKLDSARLSKEEKNGFEIRIEKKLILYPDQIQKGFIRAEKTEASGMDYIGKVRLIERTLESKNELLEITFGNPIESTTTYLVKPISLDKSKEDLVLNTVTLPEEEEMDFKIRKMSKVKRLKSSLFAP